MATESVRLPNDGALTVLDKFLAGSDGPALAHLYDNNVVYSPLNDLADYNESSFVGYAAVGPISWPAAAINPGGKAESDSGTMVWQFTAGAGTATAFGIYFTDDPPTKLLLVVPFLDPFVFSPGNATLSKALKVTEVSEF